MSKMSTIARDEIANMPLDDLFAEEQRAMTVCASILDVEVALSATSTLKAAKIHSSLHAVARDANEWHLALHNEIIRRATR